MDNLETTTKSSSLLLILLLASVITGSIVLWVFLSQEEVQEIVVAPQDQTQINLPVVEPEPAPLELKQEPIAEPVTKIEPLPIEIVKPLPHLNESDVWVQEKLPSLTWRKELLKLVINDDMIRRFVVFTENFSQGIVAYQHSPLVSPVTRFSALEIKDENNKLLSIYQWDQNSAKRFSLYVDLLRSMDTDSLIAWYTEMKPLIDQAYAELGVSNDDFTKTLQIAITKILDMELPKTSPELIRPSVMYQYKNAEIESLDDVDKLLLRLGKENLLVIKSILLEINEKLSRQSN